MDASPRVHEAAIAITGSGPASDAIGTPISMDAKNAALNGCVGRKRTEARPPRIPPTAPHAITMPQSPAPLKWSRKIFGPSTRNAAKQKFEIAKATIGARTHARDVTSRNPSRS